MGRTLYLWVNLEVGYHLACCLGSCPSCWSTTKQFPQPNSRGKPCTISASFHDSKASIIEKSSSLSAAITPFDLVFFVGNNEDLLRSPWSNVLKWVSLVLYWMFPKVVTCKQKVNHRGCFDGDSHRCESK